MAEHKEPAAIAGLETKICVIRGQRVMLDEDLAAIYGVTTSRLNEQVTRNLDRFPLDFCYQLTAAEFVNLKSHFATSRWGGRRKLPRVFTEHGAVMLASILKTPIAVTASVHVVRAFVRLREMVAAHKDLARKLSTLEDRMVEHDAKFEVVFDAIRKLMQPLPDATRPRIGFRGGRK